MFLNVALIAGWQSITWLHEHQVDDNLHLANRKCFQFDYSPGKQVLKRVPNPTKLGAQTNGPYAIEPVHVTYNLTIIICHGVTECINMCRVLPYR
ncbi:hypothetical protein ACHAWX_001593 [Stephanocyclus meneghinianus]